MLEFAAKTDLPPLYQRLLAQRCIDVCPENFVFYDLGETCGVNADTGLNRESVPPRARIHTLTRWLIAGSLLPTACVSFHSAVAQYAQTELSATPGRWYIGLGVGLSRLEPESFCRCMTISDENDLAFNVYAGVDLSRRFAIEAQYSDLGSASVDFLGDPVGSVDYQTAGVTGLLYLYESGGLGSRTGFSAYLKAGGGALFNDSNLDFTRDNDFQFWIGAGVQYGLSSGWGFRAEVNSFDSDFQQVTASVVKRFGERRVRDTAYTAPTPPAIPERLIIPNTTSDLLDELPQETTEAIAIENIYFNFDRSDVQDSMQPQLDELTARLSEQPDLSVQLAGHTDSVGPQNYNSVLSLKRAAAVRDYLVSNSISVDRISITGLGEIEPAADNETDAGRALNRRVEVSVQ